MNSNLPAISNTKHINIKKAINNALNNSAVYRLEEVINLKNKVVIIIDDYTRQTPVLPAVEILYDKIKSMGVKNEQFFILISSGTHRKMKKKELYQRLGNLTDVIKVVQHDCYDKNNLFSAGDIDGIPVDLNKLLQYDANVIGIGSIMAHKFSGWSGGGKIICPGVTGYETIFLSHKKAIIEEQISPGQSNNWFRTFINKVSQIAGLKYIINFIPGINGFFSVLAGAPKAVLNKGIKVARKNLTNWFEDRFDLAVVSAYPATYDLWQSGKGFYLGDIVTKDGGVIILVTYLNELEGGHPEFLSLLDLEPQRIKKLLDKNLINDPLAAVAAYAVSNINKRCILRVVSANSDAQQVKILGHKITDDLQMLIDKALNKGTKNVVIIDDIYVLPEKVLRI